MSTTYQTKRWFVLRRVKHQLHENVANDGRQNFPQIFHLSVGRTCSPLENKWFSKQNSNSSKVKVTLRLTVSQSVSQSVSLGVEPHLGLMTIYVLLFDSYGLVFVGRPL
jgi:hypothetical protein